MFQSRKWLSAPISIFALFIFGMVFGAQYSVHAQSQSFDHEPYPKLDFNFQSLELDLGLQPQNLRIDGAANYQLEANVSQADTITLYAGHMDISAVSVDGNSIDYSLHNDSLFVPLDQPSQKGQQYELSIRYSGNPTFGLLKNSNETIWSSQLPKAQRHWVPIVDNPHVDTDRPLLISRCHPDFQIWATGQKTNEEAASVDVMRYQFQSKGKVPASSLSLAVGKFNSVSTSAGVKKINVAVEQALSDSVNSQQLLEQAYNYMGMVEDSLAREYPYNRLNVMVLSDHSAETKQWAATTVYLYKNRGNLEAQLLRGIIGQWLGSYQRAAQWDQADAITLYQTLLHRALTDSTIRRWISNRCPICLLRYMIALGSSDWNRWLKGWQDWQNEPVKKVIRMLGTLFLKSCRGSPRGAITPNIGIGKADSRFLKCRKFALSGIPSPQRKMRPIRSPTRLTIVLNEADGKLKLSFRATQGVFNELTSITAYEVYANKTDTAEVTFTGTQDSVMLQVDPMINTLRLETAGTSRTCIWMSISRLRS
ncbi:MAG: hypothetical protein U5J63_03115 [Fodinibius sp.]|nr:hypothetical protein [Fodinibius sp.]